MTVGQRIAQKRKELGLSQEALGERLGVSRQAIYKWESDAALPEIEKLVNLSREFSVSIDWLLGEGDESRELTPDQLRMVEEIVGRYLAAQPRPEPPAQDSAAPERKAVRRGESLNWLVSVVLKIVAFVVALNLGVLLLWRQEELEERYRSLQNSISAVSSDVNSQIGSITNRVESILQSQNALTAEQSVQVVSADYRANTVTIQARALPRTYVEGMTAEFTVVSGGESLTAPGELGENHAFTAQITGPLSDDITVSVALIAGDQRQTQVLEEFFDLYFESFPEIEFDSGGLSQFRKASEAGSWTAVFYPVEISCRDIYGGAARLESLRLGLFRDQKLVEWFIREEEPDSPEGRHVFRMEPDSLELEPDCVYCVAAVAEDEFGREWVAPDWSSLVRVTSGGMDHFPDADYSGDPADWEY